MACVSVRIFGRSRDNAAVANHQVVAIASDDRVAGLATNDDVIARTGCDRVNTAIGKVDRGYHVDIRWVGVSTQFRRLSFGPHVVYVPVIPDDQVLRVGCRQCLAVIRHDRVPACATKNNVPTDPRLDVVDTAHSRHHSGQAAERQRLRAEVGCVGNGGNYLCVVAKDNVLVISCVYRIGILTAEHDVGPPTRRDDVNTANRKICRSNDVDVVHILVRDDKVHVPVVTERNVVMDARRDRVTGAAAHHDVVTVTRSDEIDATVRRITGTDVRDRERSCIKSC